MPLLCILAYQSHRLFSILGRHLPDAVWHAVLHHDQCNALTIEERRPLVTLVVHSQMAVATARTAHHGTSRGLFLVGQIHPHLRHVLRIVVARLRTFRPQIHLYRFLCRSAHRHQHHCH